MTGITRIAYRVQGGAILDIFFYFPMRNRDHAGGGESLTREKDGLPADFCGNLLPCPKRCHEAIARTEPGSQNLEAGKVLGVHHSHRAPLRIKHNEIVNAMIIKESQDF